MHRVVTRVRANCSNEPTALSCRPPAPRSLALRRLRCEGDRLAPARTHVADLRRSTRPGASDQAFDDASCRLAERLVQFPERARAPSIVDEKAQGTRCAGGHRNCSGRSSGSEDLFGNRYAQGPRVSGEASPRPRIAGSNGRTLEAPEIPASITRA